MKKKLLYLYSDVAGYVIGGIKSLIEEFDVEVSLVRWYNTKDSFPYKIPAMPGLTVYNKPDFSYSDLESLCLKISPDLVYVSGRMDKEYLRIVKKLRKNGSIIVSGFDNQWKGTFRQKLAVLSSSFLYKAYFDYLWVAGVYQYEYARRLGYPREKIIFNLYSADNKIFENYFQKTFPIKKNKFPKVFLFVGRIVKIKAVPILVQAFNEATEELNSDWKLMLVGNGSALKEIQLNEKIIHKDFVQPDEFEEIISQSGVFCLTSYQDQWGLVVHEFAITGMPLITSDGCGAHTAFVKHDYNGYTFKSGDKEDLKKVLKRIMGKTDDELIEMGLRSHELSKQINTKILAKNLMSVLEK